MAAHHERARSTPMAVPALPPQVLLVQHGTEQIMALALGLQWRVILGRDLVRLARQRADELGASHWVHAGGRAESVGLLPGTQLSAAATASWPRVSYSAAQIFARLAGEGTHVAALPLPKNPDVYWLAVARDGQVVADGDLCVSGQDLPALWQTWQQRYGESWQLWGEPPMVSPSTAPAALAWSDLAAAAGAESLLQVRHRRWRPAPWLLAGCGLLMLAWVWLWRSEPTSSESSVPASAEHDAELAVQAQRAWHNTFETWRLNTRLPTPSGLEHLAQALLLVPTQTAGWRVQRLACRHQLYETWRCTAQYRRDHRLARQQGLYHALPPEWRLQWADLEHAQAEWLVQVDSAPLQWDALPVNTETWLPDADAWLALQAFWRHIEWGRQEPVALQVPSVSGADDMAAGPANGLAATPDFTLPPEPLPVIARRSLLVSGPLRSLALLSPQFAQRTQWQALELQVGPGKQAPGLRDSALELTLQGVVYENASS